MTGGEGVGPRTPGSARSLVANFLRNETGGEKDNLNTVLILALIVLPLVLVLILFRDDLARILVSMFESTFGSD